MLSAISRAAARSVVGAAPSAKGAARVLSAARFASGKSSSDVWDEEAQTFHGGQDWAHISNFVEDFSVTTNPLGTPKKALEAARAACDTICHYPPADFEPAITDLAKWMWEGSDAVEGHSRLLLGNGASELIDLCIRDGPIGTWKPAGPNAVQYKEYERSSLASGHKQVVYTDTNADLTCIVNPNNPTGEYMGVEDMKKWVEDNCKDGSHVIVDESMQPWVGAHWREDSLLMQQDWVKKMVEERDIHVFLMHSWTKIWSCTGVRLGSVVAPTRESLMRIRAKQVPWSVNSSALAFLSEVVKDTEYMDETWEITHVWRKLTVDELQKRHPTWEVHGKPFLSWLWLDCGSEEVAEQATQLAKAAGVPVRSGKPGYEEPTMVRIAVRHPDHLELLLDAWKPLE
jgi:histidinol-phosphate/aromatic aminotransferase/cobyric acid decarboxylase-like protein